AGEVVERPASVVKELIENSIDAGAGRVEVAVEAGGKRLVRVTDDGCGMTHDDALLAFERHATSKIRSAEDLFEISTLGFRGEALPSIAAVSRLVLETRQASESSGTRIEFAGGRLRDVQEVAWPAGTRLEVRDLFFNTPARRKFLKSESTELGHVATLLTHYALAHPQRSFRLSSLTSEILNVSPVATNRERIYQVMGGQLLAQLVEIAPLERRMLAAAAPGYGPGYGPEYGEEGEPAEEPPIVRVSGFASRPEAQKLNRNNIYFFVNRRLVRDRLVLHAITEAYRNILPGGVFPVALIFLELPAAEVDVNVHPSKIEVRFRHSGFIHDFVRDSIRQALIGARPVAAFPLPKAARSGQAEDEAEVAERLAEEPPLMGGVHPPASVEAGAPARYGQARYDSAAGEHDSAPPATSPTIGGREARAPFRLSPPRPEPHTGILPLGEAALSYAPAQPRPPSVEAFSSVVPIGGSAGPAGAAGPAEKGCPAASSGLRSSMAPVAASADEFPLDLRPLGQVQESFIVATNAEGLWIIDQHVAHERILFERHLRLCRERKVEGQRLLLPIIVELKPEQQAAFEDIAGELGANGFEVEPFGQRTVAIKSAPADIPADGTQRLLLEILDGVGPEARAISFDELRARIAASVSCHAAIKVNMPLERTKMEWLLKELSLTECPMTCPHGRPIVLRYSLKEIQKAFKRL
ncbi:MAG: DNA mismatch repair endonuclease MutL, partial [Acidobacteria bacterium]